MANIGDLMTDPKLWPIAKSFDPNNFLTHEGKTKKSNSFFPFGTGELVKGYKKFYVPVNNDPMTHLHKIYGMGQRVAVEQWFST